jgi:hypothetical protein
MSPCACSNGPCAFSIRQCTFLSIGPCVFLTSPYICSTHPWAFLAGMCSCSTSPCVTSTSPSTCSSNNYTFSTNPYSCSINPLTPSTHIQLIKSYTCPNSFHFNTNIMQYQFPMFWMKLIVQILAYIHLSTYILSFLIDTTPSSLMDSITSPKVKIAKGKGIGRTP